MSDTYHVEMTDHQRMGLIMAMMRGGKLKVTITELGTAVLTVNMGKKDAEGLDIPRAK